MRGIYGAVRHLGLASLVGGDGGELRRVEESERLSESQALHFLGKCRFTARNLVL